MSTRLETLRERLTDFAHTQPDRMAEMYLELKRNLAIPPDGWKTLGYHLDTAVPLEFWGVGEDGLPIWEREEKPYCATCGTKEAHEARHEPSDAGSDS